MQGGPTLVSAMSSSEPKLPEIPGWHFSLTEPSFGVYRADGLHDDGRSVSRTTRVVFRRGANPKAGRHSGAMRSTELWCAIAHLRIHFSWSSHRAMDSGSAPSAQITSLFVATAHPGMTIYVVATPTHSLAASGRTHSNSGS
jgi:hypothetical protein